VHLDLSADVALDGFGHLEGVDDVVARADDGAKRSGLAAADQRTDERPVGRCQPLSGIAPGGAGTGMGGRHRYRREQQDERR
jgi:hypothetical protein